MKLFIPSWINAAGQRAALGAVALSVVGLGLVCWASAAQAGEKPASQVLVETGLAIPFGNLDDDFEKTRLGFGASQGLELGFRYRLFLSPSVSISPGFHFVDFGNFNGVHPDLEEYSIETWSLRYSLEFMVISPYKGYNTPRPFLAIAGGLYRNRVQGFYQDYIQAIDRSVSSLGVSFRAGLQLSGFEFSLVYHVNRFNTWHFYESDYRERYNWDSASARVAWILPF